MNLAPPIPRLERPRREPDPTRGDDRATTNRTAGQEPGRRGPARAPPARLRDPRRRRRPGRDRHPDGLLVVGDARPTSQRRRHVRDRRPADPVGRRSGIVAMVVDDAGRLPLPAPRVGAVLRRRDRRCSCSCSCREFNIVVGGSARWLQLGPLPAVHPAEFAKLALVVYLAHWFAKRGTRVRGFWAGTIPFLRDRRAGRRPRLPGARPRHDDRHHADRVHDVLRRRREPLPPRGHGRGRPRWR